MGKVASAGFANGVVGGTGSQVAQVRWRQLAFSPIWDPLPNQVAIKTNGTGFCSSGRYIGAASGNTLLK